MKIVFQIFVISGLFLKGAASVTPFNL
jgi:hypothetical protein